MRRVGIILFSNIKYCPYADFYSDILENIPDMEYDIIYFDRNSDLCEVVDAHHIPIKWGNRNSSMKFAKIGNFLSFLSQTKKILKKKKYDMLVVLTTIPAVLLYPYLNKNYKKKFILDIRDYTYENNALFYRIEKKVINAASCAVISSPGFQSFLPKSKYLICHNISKKISENNVNSHSFIKSSKQVTVSYVGTIAYVDQCKRMCDLISKDERFKFLLYGNEMYGSVVSDYVSKLNCTRIKMMGKFDPCDKERIYEESDLVFNCYGNDNMIVKYALSNKLYEGAFYKKPLVVSPNTFMSQYCREFGFALDDAAKTLDELFYWYVNINSSEYERYSQTFLERCKSENEATRETIRQILIG